ncbi:MAG TPA: prepilin peptidase [Lachnospiraceae bacterium]|nr:prepilin peptidase [Lachnospiraceae bacterium]
MEVLLNIFTILFLMTLAVIDMKERKIPCVVLSISFLIALLSTVLVKHGITTEQLCGMTIGFLFILISFVTRGQLGLGDGITVVITGVVIGFWDNLLMVLYALFAAGITAIILIVFKRSNRKERIPFLPFLLLGYIVVLSTKLL